MECELIMIKKVNLVNNTMSFFLEFLVFYIAVFEGIILLKHDYKDFYFPFAVLPLLIMSFIMRRFLNNVISFSLSHIALYLICFFLPLDSSKKALIVLTLTAITILDFRFWSKSSSKKLVTCPNIFFESLFIITLTHGTIVASKSIIILSYSFGLLFLIGKFISNYLNNLEIYIARNYDIKNIPIKQLIGLNSSILFLIIFLIFIILFIIKALNIEKYLYAPFEPIIFLLKTGFIAFLKYIFSLTESVNPSFQEQEELISVEEATATLGSQSTLVKILEFFFNAFIFILILLFCYFIIKIIYYYVKNNFSKHTLNTDEIEYLNTDKISDKKEKIGSSISLKPKNNNEKIRSLFYKKIKKNKKLHINNTFTAKEISNKFLKYDNISLDELTNLYEKARYSNSECSKDEVEKAKKL